MVKNILTVLTVAALVTYPHMAFAETVTGTSLDSAKNAKADARKSAELLCRVDDKEYKEIRIKVEDNGGSWTATLTYRCV